MQCSSWVVKHFYCRKRVYRRGRGPGSVFGYQGYKKNTGDGKRMEDQTDASKCSEMDVPTCALLVDLTSHDD